MQSSVKALALTFALSASASASSYSDEILEDCPNLNEGAVETTIIKSDISFDTSNWQTISLLYGDINHHNAAAIRDNLLFRNADTQYHLPHLVMINSTGGNLHQSQMLVNIMLETLNLYTLCASEASSAAFSVLVSGTDGNRYAIADCSAIMHASTSGLQGNYDIVQQQQNIKSLERAEAERKKITIQQTKIDDNCYNALTSNGDLPLNANDMLSLGAVDAILHYSGEMTVRTGDPRIAYQVCVDEKLKDTETPTQAQVSQAFDACPMTLTQ